MLSPVQPLLNPLQEYVTGKIPPATYSILPHRGRGRKKSGACAGGAGAGIFRENT